MRNNKVWAIKVKYSFRPSPEIKKEVLGDSGGLTLTESGRSWSGLSILLLQLLFISWTTRSFSNHKDLFYM